MNTEWRTTPTPTCTFRAAPWLRMSLPHVLPVCTSDPAAETDSTGGLYAFKSRVLTKKFSYCIYVIICRQEYHVYIKLNRINSRKNLLCTQLKAREHAEDPSTKGEKNVE